MLPEAFPSFLTHPEAFGHFLMLHYASYCLLTPPDKLLLLSVHYCNNIKKIINKQTKYWDSKRHNRPLKYALLKTFVS